MKGIEMISIKAAINDYIDQSGVDERIDEARLLKFANDALDRIHCDELMVHQIALLTVKDYKVQLPQNFKYVCQAAYRIKPTTACTREEVVSFTQQVLDGTGCKLKIDMECPACHNLDCCCDGDTKHVVEVDANKIWQSAHPEYQTAYMKHFSSYGNTTGRGYSSCYHPDFYLMKKSTGNFSHSQYHIKDCINLNIDCEVEYTIDYPNLIVNFKEGEVLLSYLAVKTDEEGYRMMPNTAAVGEGVFRFIEERMAYIEYKKTKEQRDRIFWQQCYELKEKTIARARSEVQTPDPDDWSSFVFSFWKTLLPRWTGNENLGRSNGSKFFRERGSGRWGV